MNHKDRITKAIANFEKRNAPKKPTGRRNGKPEKLVQDQVLAHLRQKGWSVDVVESKAVYSHRAGRYLRGQTRPGMTDLVGVTGPIGPHGLAIPIFIELKAPGRISTVRPAQVEFMAEKSRQGAFCAVVDSIERFTLAWDAFCKARGIAG